MFDEKSLRGTYIAYSSRHVRDPHPPLVRINTFTGDTPSPDEIALLSLYCQYKAEREASDRDDLRRMINQDHATAPGANTLHITHKNDIGWTYRWGSWEGTETSTPTSNLADFLHRVESIDGPEHATAWARYQQPNRGFLSLAIERGLLPTDTARKNTAT